MSPQFKKKQKPEIIRLERQTKSSTEKDRKEVYNIVIVIAIVQ